MNRKGLFFRSLVAGYFSVGANFLFTIFSVPLALHFLSKEEFGLWAVVLQIGGYLMLLDLGMSSAVSRFLADHKGDINTGHYGDILNTGRWFFWIQALVVGGLALGAAAWLPGLLGIPGDLTDSFRRLVVGQGWILALGLFFRPYSLPLWANQRTDITHWAASANLISALVAMAACFQLGLGVDSFLAGSLIGALWVWLLPWAACRRLRLFPSAPFGGTFQRDVFFKMLRFGRDVLLLQLGGLLCLGSQILVVTKTLGLEAAAVFAVATKFLTLGQQLLGRILESAAPALTEMFVQGDRTRFQNRFYRVVGLSTVLATLAGIALMAANHTWVSLWTRGAVIWTQAGDNILGALLIMTVTSRCLLGAFTINTELFRVRFLSLLEGICFIGLALVMGPAGGLEGILAISLLCHCLITLGGAALQIQSSLPCPNFWRQTPFWIAGNYLIGCFLNFWWAEISANPFLTFCWAGALVLIAAVVMGCGLRGLWNSSRS